MQQAKISLTVPLVEFLEHHRQYGFKDKSSMVQSALLHLKEEIDRRDLELSADLYAETYDDDPELQELTESAIAGWPE